MTNDDGELKPGVVRRLRCSLKTPKDKLLTSEQMEAKLNEESPLDILAERVRRKVPCTHMDGRAGGDVMPLLLDGWWSWNMVTAHRVCEMADGEWRTLCGLQGSLKLWGSSEQRPCLRCQRLQHRYTAKDEVKGA